MPGTIILQKQFNIINNTFFNNNVSIYWEDPAQYQVNCVVRNNILVQYTGNSILGSAIIVQNQELQLTTTCSMMLTEPISLNMVQTM